MYIKGFFLLNRLKNPEKPFEHILGPRILSKNWAKHTETNSNIIWYGICNIHTYGVKICALIAVLHQYLKFQKRNKIIIILNKLVRHCVDVLQITMNFNSSIVI